MTSVCSVDREIRSQSYSECINELTLRICRNTTNGILLVIAMTTKSQKRFWDLTFICVVTSLRQ